MAGARGTTWARLGYPEWVAPAIAGWALRRGAQNRETAPMTESRTRTLSAAELADETGTTAEHIARIVEIGALHELSPGRHEAADIPRVETILRLEEAGIGLDVLGSSIVTRFANLEYIGRYFLEPQPRSERTFAEFRASLGAQGDLLGAVYTAFGLPEPAADARLRVDEERIMAGFLDVWRLVGEQPEPYVRAARIVGEAIRRTVDGWTSLWGETVYQPLVAREGYTEELSARIGEQSTRMAELIPSLLVWLQQRHTAHAINELNVGSFEEALEREGLRPPRVADPPAVAFVDLTGYTSLTEASGDEHAARSAARLHELADDAARRHDGRLVKLLGDGAMLRFPDAATGVTATLGLVAAIGASGLPPAHAGIASGRVIERDGDLFGRTVNLAARIAGRASAGQVLVDAATAEMTGRAGTAFEAIGAVALKGVAEPVELWLALVGDKA